MKEIYLDNAATTRIDDEVLRFMLPYLIEDYGNPSSMHNKGIVAREAIDSARETVSHILGCSPDEIIFTGSGTESDNMAIFGYARKNKDRGNHIITTKIEHHAVLDSFKRLEKEGFSTTYLDVDEEGFIDLKKLEDSITDQTLLVSIIYANNEIGVIQDIKKIADICRKKNVVMHTDACQAPSYLDIDVRSLGVSMMTLNGSKIYGPKGVGILYKGKDIEIEPVIYGGGQEYGLRSGTENVANIVGFAKALELVEKRKKEEYQHTLKLRNILIDELLKIPETKLNGSQEKRLPNNVNISFLNIEGESMLLMLNEEGICASTGSACTSKSLEASHVITAMGYPDEIGHCSIRFSLGKDNTEKEIFFTIEKVKEIVKKLRQYSALDRTLEEVLSEGRKKHKK